MLLYNVLEIYAFMKSYSIITAFHILEMDRKPSTTTFLIKTTNN